MSADKVARLLANFDQPETAQSSARIVPFDHALHFGAKTQSRPAPMPAPAPPPEDDRYQRGVSDGYDAASLEHEQKLKDEKERWAARLQDAEKTELNETAARIANNVQEIGNQLEANIAGVVARILEPLISSAVQRQAVTTFVERLSSVATDSRRPLLKVTGPSELIELVRSKLGVRSIAIELRAEPVAEVSIVVDQVVLETQVKVWADRLKFAVLT